jgi:hypothetical protein
VSELADYILRGQIAEARALAEQRPSSMSEPSTGPEQLLPADIARRCGHDDMVVFFLRLNAPSKLTLPQPDVGLLRSYLSNMCQNTFCAAMIDGFAASVWEQIFGDRQVFFDSQDPQFGMADFEKQDIRWLLEKCGIISKDAFVALEN